MSDTPITDAEEDKQKAEYDNDREIGYPPFPADFSFARKFEHDLARKDRQIEALLEQAKRGCPPRRSCVNAPCNMCWLKWLKTIE